MLFDVIEMGGIGSGCLCVGSFYDGCFEEGVLVIV